MAFLLYSLRNEGVTTYQLVRKISLGGKSGPVSRFVCSPATAKPRWKICESQLLRLVDGGEKNAVVVDLKPEVRRNVSLYRIRDIWGYSADGWTPILLKLTRLFSDRDTENPQEFKQSFDEREARIETVYEFLYLQGECSDDSWSWGRVGNVNGTLLFPEALDYFLGVLNAAIQSPKPK